MATQDFVSGGFYGKVGQLVGQRWKNKRTIRSYVIPHNPRTEKQQTNRMKFAKATALAQEAMRFNKGSPVWDSDRMTEFMWRVSTARRAVDLNYEWWESLPLFPSGYHPSIVIDDVKDESPDSAHLVLTSSKVSQWTNQRNLYFCVAGWNTTAMDWEVAYYIKETVIGDGTILNADSPFTSIEPGTLRIIGVSCDDREKEMALVSIPPQTVEQGDTITIDDLEPSYISETELAFSSVKAGSLSAAYTLNVTLVGRNALDDTEQTIAETVTSVVGGAYWFKVEIPWNFSLAKGGRVSAVVGSVPSGAQKIVVPSQQVETEVKVVSVHADIGYTTLVPGNRRNAMAAITLESAFTVLQGSIIANSAYTEYHFNEIPEEVVGVLDSFEPSKAQYEILTMFTYAPLAVDENIVVYDVSIGNDLLRMEGEISSSISDSTATVYELPILRNIESGDFIDLFGSIPEEVVDLWNSVGCGAKVWGQDLLGEREGLQTEVAECSVGKNYAQIADYVNIEIERVYPVDGGAVAVWQSNYESADTVYIFKKKEIALGKVSAIGISAFEELVAEVLPPSVSIVTGMRYSNNFFKLKSKLGTEFNWVDGRKLFISDSEGEEIIATGTSWQTGRTEGQTVKGYFTAESTLGLPVDLIEGVIYFANKYFQVEGSFSFE